MSANPRTFEYILAGVDNLVGRGHFHNGAGFRPTQGDALLAYHEYLHNDDLTPEEKLEGFFEIPTGVGKTAVFLAVLDEAHRVARANNDKLRAMIVVPTIAIMTQMKEGEQEGEKGEVEEWAPDFMGKVGFYGGDDREFGEELTIITYDSWTALMEAGEIDSSNVDILVSDEAHRGTSERRVTNIFNAFANGTLRIAFTATASFDEDKSVEQSHGHRIFSRGPAESIRLNELAAYIQVQLYMIRLQPPKLTDEFEEVRETEAERLGKKQEAWMRQMVEVLRDRRDIHTNDLLSDNKSGFYVRGTAMADRMAMLANADPVLQERAREQGKKGVMIAIHSNMHPAEQMARMKAFKRGDYLAAASDTQLKEGFNNKTLKNVFDYPRGSLVDKAQIIGRAARKWFNEAKQRFEGATIIDTIVYEGSDDPEQDERNKNHAIRYAIMAWSVLEGTAVFAPKFENDRPGHGGGGGGGGGIAPVYGLDVTSYIDLEDLQAIYAHQQKLIDEGTDRANDYVEFSDEKKELLKQEFNRTRLTTVEFLKKSGLECYMSDNTLNSWRNNYVSTISQELWEKVINASVTFPNGNTLDITNEMHDSLLRHKERTGVGARVIAKLVPNAPKYFSNKIDTWLSRRATIAKVSEWDLAIKAYESLPDKEVNPKVDYTDQMHQELLSLRGKAGVGTKAFLKLFTDVPEGMSEGRIQNLVLKRSVKQVSQNDWMWLIGKYKIVADKKSHEQKPKAWVINKDDPNVFLINDEMHEVLMRHAERTGLGSVAILKKCPDAPESINAQRVNGWMRHRGATYVHQDEWDWLIKRYESMPDKKPKGPAPSP